MASRSFYGQVVFIFFCIDALFYLRVWAGGPELNTVVHFIDTFELGGAGERRGDFNFFMVKSLSNTFLCHLYMAWGDTSTNEMLIPPPRLFELEYNQCGMQMETFYDKTTM
jgi:hypothetical protein